MKTKYALILIGILAAVIASASGFTWSKNYKTALATAKKANKVVMIDFTASWCVNCHKLERTTYKDPSVVKLLANTVPVQVDYDKENAIAKKYKAEALPVIVFTDGAGKEYGRLTGYMDAKEFVAKAAPILAKARKK